MIQVAPGGDPKTWEDPERDLMLGREKDIAPRDRLPRIPADSSHAGVGESRLGRRGWEGLPRNLQGHFRRQKKPGGLLLDIFGADPKMCSG
jgi:hypothetical protein